MKFQNNPKEIVDNVFNNVDEAQKQAIEDIEEMEDELFDTYNPLNDVPVEVEDAEKEVSQRRFADSVLQSITKVEYEKNWTPNKGLAYRWIPITLNSRQVEITDEIKDALKQNEDVYYVYYNGNHKLYSEKLNRETTTLKTIPNSPNYDRIVVNFPKHPENNYVAWDVTTKEMVQIDNDCRCDDFGKLMPLELTVDVFTTKMFTRCKLDDMYNPVAPNDDEVVKYSEEDQKTLNQIRANFR